MKNCFMINLRGNRFLRKYYFKDERRGVYGI